MISSDVRHAIGRAVAAAGLAPADPRLRPTGTPGQYASSVAFAFSEPAGRVAARLAAELDQDEHLGRAEVTGPGFITITVRPEALAGLPERIVAAGPACASSDALLGRTVPVPPPADPLAAAGWEEARAALAAQLTARLAAAAGATAADHRHSERSLNSDPRPHDPAPEITAAVAFAGADTVRFSLARAIPGRPVAIDPLIIARHMIDNPAYAVRYAHARAASGERWAAAVSRGEDPPYPLMRWLAGPMKGEDIGPASQRGYLGNASSGVLVLLDALSWLPERVATAARRGRPDEFARYLEELARAAIAALICAVPASPAGDPESARAPGADRLGVAGAARTGLAAGLGLLGVSAPDRL